MSNAVVQHRTSGRVILLTPGGRVFLFEGVDPDCPESTFWYTPGGGLKPGESAARAAARELREETSLVVEPLDLGEQVFQNHEEYWYNREFLHLDSHFFLLRVPSDEIEISTEGFTEMERQTCRDLRWWSAEALEQSGVTYYPVELPSLVKRLR